MAIEHTNQSIGEASAALAGAAAQSAWRDALVDHASGAWSLEEEFDSSGSTVHWVVVKNDHTVSGAGADFYVCIGRVAADGTMGCCVGEEYTAASNLLSKFAPRSDNQGYILGNDFYGGASSTDPATFTLGTTLPNANALPLFTSIAAAGTERLFTCVEEDYAILNVNGVSMYVGVIEDLIVPKTGLVATPAIGCGDLLNGTQGKFFSITRHPIAAADAPVQISGAHSMIPPASGYLDVCCIHNLQMLSGIYGFPDRYQGDRVAASELAAIMLSGMNMGYNQAVNTMAKMGALRGKFKGIRMTTGPYAAAAYDDIAVDGNKHIVMGVYSSLSVNSPYQQFLIPVGYEAVVKPMFVMDTGVPA